MPDRPEYEWKRKFAHTLAKHLAVAGTRADYALQHAYAQAEDYYPVRGRGKPEDEAEQFHQLLSPNGR